MKQEFSIGDTWLPFEIHPETPKDGVLLADYFPGMNMAEFAKRLNSRGRDMNIHFGEQTRLSNSRMAMEAGEFARDHGGYDIFHKAMFKAYFTDLRDIGQRDVVLDIAGKAGLDTKALTQALDNGMYLSRLEDTTRKARESLINSAPTFVIEGGGTIVGAQPFETFRQALAVCA